MCDHPLTTLHGVIGQQRDNWSKVPHGDRPSSNNVEGTILSTYRILITKLSN